MSNSPSLIKRRGARTKGGVPPAILARLKRGEIETVNLMEWLAVDMGALAHAIARQSRSRIVRLALLAAAEEMPKLGIVGRLQAGGRAIATAQKRSTMSHFAP